MFCSPLSVFGWIFKHVFAGCHTSWDWKVCFFINSVTFWAFKAFLPSTRFYQSVFVRALQGWKRALSLLTQLVGSQCEHDSDCTQVWWNAITEQPQIPKENCNSEDDQGIFVSAELCTVGVHMIIPKLILLTWTFRMVGFVTFTLVVSSSIPNQGDYCHRCSVKLLVKSRRLHCRWLETEIELSTVHSVLFYSFLANSKYSRNFSWTLHSFLRETEISFLCVEAVESFVCVHAAYDSY